MIGPDKELKYSYSGISDYTAVLPALIFRYVTYLPELIAQHFHLYQPVLSLWC